MKNTIRRRFALFSAWALVSFAVLTVQIQPAAAFPQNPANFSMRSLSGANVTAESLKGHPVVFAFGAAWLPLSRTQLQGIKQLAETYGPKGVAIYWVSTDSDSAKSKNFASDEQVRAYASKYGIQATVLRDPDSAVAKQFKVSQLPAVVILDKNGAMSGGPIEGLDPNRNLMDQVAPQVDRVLESH